LLLPAGYLAFVLLASLMIARGAAGFASKAALPVALATMQMAWGLGFLTSPASLVPQGAPASWEDHRRE